MSRLPYLVLMLLFVVLPAHAQNPHYRLHIPTAAEYLQAVPEILASIELERADYTDNFRAFWETIRFELDNREWNFEDVSYEVLNHAYHTLPIAIPYSEPNNPDVWQERLVTAWLRENDVDLSTQDEIRFENYIINITRVDFNNDSVDELVLDITLTGANGDEDFAAYWVIQQNEASAIGYRRVQTPPLWFSSNCDFRWVCSGAAQILNLEDVNADGLLEWIVAVGSYCGYGECGGHLLIMGWRDGEIISLAQHNNFDDLFWHGVSGGGLSPLLPPEGTWTLQNVDDDAAQELLQRRQYSDNRDCAITNTRVFDWHPEQDAYISGEITIEYDDTAACALRQGQAEMKTGAYEAAIQFYLHAIELLPVDGDGYEREARQYVQIRLVEAYALDGREEEAIALFTDLQGQAPESDIMDDLIDAMAEYQTNRDVVELCAGVFNAVLEFNIYGDNSNFWTFGQTDNIPYRPQTYTGGDFSAANSGCDLPGMLDNLITHHRFAMNQLPSVQMERLGWPINAQFSADLNGDGQDEWLLWPDAPVGVIVFVTAGDSYQISSYPYILAPNEHAHFSTWLLPNEAGTALSRIAFGEVNLHEDAEYCGSRDQYGKLNMWRLEEAMLISVVSGVIFCESSQVSDLFPRNDELHGRTWDGLAEVIYAWDENTLTFVSATNRLADENNFDCFAAYDFCGFERSDSSALEIMNAALANPPEDIDPSFLLAVHYRRALILESLNRCDEALADYIIIYETAPESAWGMLAALHIIF